MPNVIPFPIAVDGHLYGVLSLATDGLLLDSSVLGGARKRRGFLVNVGGMQG